MKDYRFYIIAILTAIVFSSCDKVVNLKLGSVTGKLVIEGNIINVSGMQYIKLSRNVAFTGTNTYPAVTGATVSVTDNRNRTYQFTEGPTGTYSINLFGGFGGTSYTMSVLTDGTTYKATSIMPELVALDSVTSKKDDFNSTKNKREITVHFSDSYNVPNQYRFVMYVNGVQVKRVFAFDDEFSDGRYVDLDLIEDDIDIYPGDKVAVEMQCIDKPMYTYWFTLEQQQPEGPGGGVAPSNPPTNITPTVLGYFSAHTTQTDTITVK